jgi:hypothetical protein
MSEVVRLAESRQFDAAAVLALELANAPSFGNARQKLDRLLAAAKFFHLAGNSRRSVGTYRDAFDELDATLAHSPSASLVVHNIAQWPEIFSRASFAALDLGLVDQAIEFAERGRFLVLGERVGPANKPAGVDDEAWRAYVATWRHAGQLGANRVLRGEDEALRKQLRDADDAIRSARRRMGNGVNLDTPPLDLDIRKLCESLPDDVTTVYTVRLDANLRFVQLERDIAREIVAPPGLGARLVAACDARAEKVRSLHAIRTGDVRSMVDYLCAEGGPAMAFVFGAALGDRCGRRVLWIPHGALAGMPLWSCPVGETGKVVADVASLMIAASLAEGAHDLANVVDASPHATCIRGREDRRTSTEGGSAITCILDKGSHSRKPGRAAGGGSRCNVCVPVVSRRLQLDRPSANTSRVGARLRCDRCCDHG